MNNILCSTAFFIGATAQLGFDNDVVVQPLPAEQKVFVLYCRDRLIQLEGCSTSIKDSSLIVRCE